MGGWDCILCFTEWSIGVIKIDEMAAFRNTSRDENFNLRQMLMPQQAVFFWVSARLQRMRLTSIEHDNSLLRTDNCCRISSSGARELVNQSCTKCIWTSTSLYRHKTKRQQKHGFES